MSSSSMTVADLEAFCYERASNYSVKGEGYQPTAKQIFFFTLVWLRKQQKKEKLDLVQQRQDQVEGFDEERLKHNVLQIANHLAEWGIAVTRLQGKHEQEWELLRIQMGKAAKQEARYRGCLQRVNLIDEAVSKALYKVVSILHAVSVQFCASHLDHTDDIIELVIHHWEHLTNIYDFHKEFYPYAGRIAKNELLTLLRDEAKSRRRELDLEDNTEKNNSSSYQDELIIDGDDDLRLAEWRIQLAEDLPKLLALIEKLPTKARQVTQQTLAARSQFWTALDMTGTLLPAKFPPPTDLGTDTAIAKNLNITENDVRVHRWHAKKRVQEIDPALGVIFEVLMANHF